MIPRHSRALTSLVVALQWLFLVPGVLGQENGGTSGNATLEASPKPVNASTPEPSKSPKSPNSTQSAPAASPAPTPNAFFTSPGFRSNPSSTLESNASSAMASANFDTAIPFLVELVARMQDSKSSEQLERLRSYYLALGQAYSSVERYSEALVAYLAFRDRFPGDRLVESVNQTVANLLEASGASSEAATAYQNLLLTGRNLTPAQRQDFTARMIDNLVASERWGEVAQLIPQILTDSMDGQTRSRLQSLLLVAYAQLGSLDAARSMLEQFAGLAQQGGLDPVTILRLVMAGDLLWSKKESVLAMSFYQIAVGSGDLKGAIQLRMDALQARRKELLVARAKPEEITSVNFDLRRQRAALEMLEQQGDVELDIRARIANAYEEIDRPFERLAVLQSIAEDYPDSTYAEQSSAKAFFLAYELMLDAKALRLANTYLERFPTAPSFPDVILGKANLLLRQRENGLVSVFIEDVLNQGILGEKDRDMLLMLGVAQFNNGQLDAAEKTFKRISAKYDDEQAGSATAYWLALVRLFRNDYEGAYEDFQRYVATYSHLEGNNTQDAAFRAGVCLYAMEQYDRARVHFESWLQKYPSGARRAGVYAFLGDIEAYHGKGEEALRYYRRVERTPGVTDDDIAYANQRMAAVYEMFFKDWKSIKELYQTYLANYGTKGNYTEAIYRIGQAQSQLGETDAMLEGYREAIANYGDDPNAFQMDDVLDLYLAEFIRLNHRFPADEFQKLRSLADPSDRPTLHLRLARAADQVDPTIPGAPAKLPMAEVLTAKNLRHASPAIALWMGEQAIASDRAFARKCFQKIENEADAGRIAAEATYQLATMDLADGHTAEAITRLEKFRGEFISSPRAPRALLDLATQFKGQERWEDALAACRQVLENKQWKGAAWPEALYLSGEVEFERSRYADAHAFFQRVYLLYAGYPEWMAKAYLRAAICAERLGRFEDAETTLREMASIEGLESFSAYREGNELLKQLTK